MAGGVTMVFSAASPQTMQGGGSAFMGVNALKTEPQSRQRKS
jgi:hypothetical protein